MDKRNELTQTEYQFSPYNNRLEEEHRRVKDMLQGSHLVITITPNIRTRCMMDAGTELNLIGGSFLKKLKEKGVEILTRETKTRIKNNKGEEIKLLGTALIPVTFAGENSYISAEIEEVDDNYDILIGEEFLEQRLATLNFATATITLTNTDVLIDTKGFEKNGTKWEQEEMIKIKS